MKCKNCNKEMELEEYYTWFTNNDEEVELKEQYWCATCDIITQHIIHYKKVSEETV